MFIVLGCSGPVSPRSRREPSSACRAGVPPPVFCSLFIHAICLPPFSSSYFIPSPLHIIPSPLCPHPLPLTLSHPPLRSHLSDSSFFHRSTPPPPSCCSESLKGTELGGALGCGLQSFRVAPYPDPHASLKCPNGVTTCETQKATTSHQI